jgi:NAD(P)-dependent dehydrogenase (short-subunit alcohol dehydrogenase family)
MRKRNTAAAAIGIGIGAAMMARALRRSRGIDFDGRVVLVTGGSRGLGLIMAREFVAEGARVVLLARDEAELDRAREDLESRGGDVLTLQCDVRDRDEVENAVDDIVERFGRIDVVINNAGVIQVGPFEHMTIDDFEEAMEVHFWGPLYLTLAALPHLRRVDGARIVNISSIGGKMAVPHLLPYVASKFALTGFSDGLRAELAKDGVSVTTVAPGLMRTGSQFNAFFKGRHRGEFAWFLLFGSLPVASKDAQAAARQIVEACRRGDAQLTITTQARAAVIVNALMPGVVAFAMSLANRLLPRPDGDAGKHAKSGWQSSSRWAPSFLTRLTERASLANNEVPVAK